MTKKTASRHAVEICPEGYDPSTISISAGDCICWTNDDAVVHTVTDDPPGTVDSGGIQPGASYERTFATAGTFPYSCKYMPMMKGTVTVS